MWEWEWDCIIPRQPGGEGGGKCRYEGGERVELPGKGVGRFEGGGGEGGETFEVGIPLLFVVRVNVLEKEGGGVVAEGQWEEVFSVIEEGETGLEILESQWVCEGGEMGYLVRFFSSDSQIDSSELFSLWAEVYFGFFFNLFLKISFLFCFKDDQDFGELVTVKVDSGDESNQVTEIYCSCDRICSGSTTVSMIVF